MRKNLIVPAVVLVLGCSALVAFQKTEVTVGDLTTCENCQKEMTNTVHVVKVPWWQADNFHAEKKLDLCRECGNQLVSYTVATVCQFCKKAYQTETRNAPRRDRLQNTRKADGYCPECNSTVYYDFETICEHCGKTYKKERMHSLKRHAPSAPSRRQGYCDLCNAPINWVVELSCEQCGKQYGYHHMMIRARDQDNAKAKLKAGLCGWCKAREAARNFGQRAGEISGDVIEGMVRGTRSR